jgi:hypothetical protein
MRMSDPRSPQLPVDSEDGAKDGPKCCIMGSLPRSEINLLYALTWSCIIVYLFEFANLCLFMFVVVEM